MMRRIAAFLALLTIVSTAAAAQSQPDRDRTHSIAAGVQWASPYTGHGEPPGVAAGWRRWFSPHVGIGADVRWGTRNRTTEIDSPEQPGPGGITIRAQHGVEDLRKTSQAYGVGILARGLLGRVSFIGGIGPAVFVERTAHDTRINDFQDAGTSTFRSVGAQGVMEVEARVAGRVSVFAGLRIDLRDARDSESTVGYPAAGVRFAF